MQIKKVLIIGLLCTIIGSIQMYWFLPEGVSCFNPNEGLFDAVLKFMILQLIFVISIFLFVKEKFSRYMIPVFLCLFWFFINKHEFTYRHACWSTYLQSEIWLITFRKSLIPIITCLLAFTFPYLSFLKKFDT